MVLNQKSDILNLTADNLAKWLNTYDIKPFRAKQILKWIYNCQADDFEVMTDLGKSLRSLLSENFFIGRLKKEKILISSDGAKKYLFKLTDQNFIETVLIPEKNHFTLCISSQAGCALGCRFCLTSRGGLIRNLTLSEIISQVRDVENDLPDKSLLTNIVFMGMGEPLANYENVANAVNTFINNETGLKYKSRKITVSTAGIVPKLYDLGRDTKANLAVSLNATDDDARSNLMPINRKYPIDQVLEACKKYPLRPHRRITFEYILIEGINDSMENAKRLAKLLRSIKAKINLIPFNEFEGCEFKRPEEKVVQTFLDILVKNHYTAIIRRSKGEDIYAACGQLRAKLNN
jgi:23S rRNA (adenine2503-C2)-methyltransferase